MSVILHNGSLSNRKMFYTYKILYCIFLKNIHALTRQSNVLKRSKTGTMAIIVQIKK
jgi:hypothetical protein